MKKNSVNAGPRIELQKSLPIPGTVPSSPGLKYLQKYANGDSLTCRQAIVAQCCFCSGYYADGRADCGSKVCPLYAWMPYRAGRNAGGKGRIGPRFSARAGPAHGGDHARGPDCGGP